ncbi:glycosyltransferase family 25 protein [Campylobacter sp. RM9756]|uniref:glycosyltransferase family 25 protein n=1 Tax=Campylobacter molothri TaxID=1032242 RepID=UPI001D7C1886|nr:glycosyltransferase family 25 protein [Campylobacter sp. RM9756]
MKVFIINLERSKDRKEHMRNEINKLFAYNPELKEKLEFIFSKAVDAKNNDHLEFKEHFPWWASWVMGRELSDGEKACFASHYKLWQECIRLNEPIIILEDDVYFSEEFLNDSQNIVEKLLNAEYECIRFCYITKTKMTSLKDNFSFTIQSIGGAQGYFLKPSAALKLTTCLRFWFKPVDNLIDMYYHSRVFTIVYTPSLIKFTNIPTTIIERDRKICVFKKIIREVCRLYFIFLKISYKKKINKIIKYKSIFNC